MEPERTSCVREDSGGAENAADGLFHQPVTRGATPPRVSIKEAAHPPDSGGLSDEGRGLGSAPCGEPPMEGGGPVGSCINPTASEVAAS